MVGTVCDEVLCNGCAACKDGCPRDAISIEDNLKSMKAEIDEKKCIDCGKCKRVCPRIYQPIFIKPICWYEGWANKQSIRGKSSSGGLARAVSEYFINNIGIVFSCAFCDGKFVFKKAERVEELDKFSGSKYVKSNPEGCYEEILSCLRKGEKILFIGLPCQVAAVKNYTGEKYIDDLYTIDLICHGSPSAKLLELFLRENNWEINKIKTINFRKKTQFSIDSKGFINATRVMDRYTVAFLAGISYTQNCYSCQFARFERVSDLTLGDSWGSKLVDESKRGISLVLCQSHKGQELLVGSDLFLKDVDVDEAVAANRQLRKPMEKPGGYDKFFLDIEKGVSFKKAVSRQCKKQCLKQDVKAMLIKLHIIDQTRGDGRC